jgi:hypothetical protein
MRNKITKKFDDIWLMAERYNTVNKKDRFARMYDQSTRFISMGIYDTVTHKYALFNTVNLTGNFRYNSNIIPEELFEMERLVRSA